MNTDKENSPSETNKATKTHEKKNPLTRIGLITFLALGIGLLAFVDPNDTQAQVCLLPDARITINPDESRVTNRITSTFRPSAALANPVTAAALRKGAISAGTWLVAVAVEWGAHGFMDRMDKSAAVQDEKAITTVNGARWLSNE